MEKAFEIQNFSYSRCLSLLDTLDERHLTTVPAGFNNNVLWNVGHIAVTHQLLCYAMAGLPTFSPKPVVDALRKGSKPGPSGGLEHLGAIREALRELPEIFRKDYQEGRFANYSPYTTSTGIVLSSVDDAFLYSTMHDGLHLGVVSAQLKVLG